MKDLEFSDVKLQVASYCKLDDLSDQDEFDLEACILFAQGYLDGAGISVPEPGTPRFAVYLQCVKAIVLDAWDNRGTAMVGVSLSANPVFQWAKNQLKLTEPVPDSGT